MFRPSSPFLFVIAAARAREREGEREREREIDEDRLFLSFPNAFEFQSQALSQAAAPSNSCLLHLLHRRKIERKDLSEAPIYIIMNNIHEYQLNGITIFHSVYNTPWPACHRRRERRERERACASLLIGIDLDSSQVHWAWQSWFVTKVGLTREDVDLL